MWTVLVPVTEVALVVVSKLPRSRNSLEMDGTLNLPISFLRLQLITYMVPTTINVGPDGGHLISIF